MTANLLAGGIITDSEIAGWQSPLLLQESPLSSTSPTVFWHGTGDFFQQYSANEVTILVRGCLAAGAHSAPENLLRTIHSYYRQHADIPTARLEGAFTLMVLDAAAGRVLLYRNLAGAGATYYIATPHGLLFASRLPHLLELAGGRPQVNDEVLPAYFLFRTVPGRDTLFRGVQRLLPGELVGFDRGGLVRSQRQTFALWQGGQPIERAAVDCLDQTLGEILGDYARLRPEAANLLSGGVDSSYIQARWNRVRSSSGQPRSFAIAVEHPRTRGDADYASSAAAVLGTQHTFVPANGPYIDYLLDTLAATGEPPNHVQSAYFGTLAQSMVAHGCPVGLCGEGADSLFGLGLADELHEAQWLRRLVPTSWGRQWGTALLRQLGITRLQRPLELAEFVTDLAHPGHPVNRAATFTHWPTVTACFGESATRTGLAYRRALLERFAVPPVAMHGLHLIGYLGEAVDSATLWTTLFNQAGGDLLCPFLDSRLLRVTTRIVPQRRFVYRRPKDLLKKALSRHAPRFLADRPKLGFGQPIFEWLAPGGQLRPFVEAIAPYPFLRGEVLAAAKLQPNWFLYSLLCYDLWHKLFIERSLQRPEVQFRPAGETSVALLAGRNNARE